MKWTKLKKSETKSEVLNVRITPSHLEKLEEILEYLNRGDGLFSKSDLIQNFIDVAHHEVAKKK